MGRDIGEIGEWYGEVGEYAIDGGELWRGDPDQESGNEEAELESDDESGVWERTMSVVPS